MYKVIGVDQKEYGPISPEQMQQWIAEGRVNAQSLVWSDASGNWKPLSTYPEFAASFPSVPPTGSFPGAGPTPFATGGDRAAAINKVAGPAIGLMVIAGLAILAIGLTLIAQLLGISLGAAAGSNSPWSQMMGGPMAILSGALGMVFWVVVFVGALKMKKLENYGFALAASILAMVPCSLCCLVGLPVGIWALVVINKPEVKSQFR